jgi:hypothetical protein
MTYGPHLLDQLSEDGGGLPDRLGRLSVAALR